MTSKWRIQGQAANLQPMKQIRCLSFSLAAAALLLSSLVLTGCKSLPANNLATHDSSNWEKSIADFEARDVTNRPPENCIVFVGSSSIAMWKSLKGDFPGLPVVNRGFGGSHLADSVNFAHRIITPYKPRQVVVYAGGNDISSKKPPELVYGDFVALAQKIRRNLPNARISYISIAGNPNRWEQVEQVKQANSMIQRYCDTHKNMDFINVFPLMLGPDGLPKPGIFLADQLHMNEKGYAIWKEAARPYLK